MYQRYASQMPPHAMSTESSISKYSIEAPDAACVAAASPPSSACLAITGSRNLEKRSLPPSDSGQPTQPPTTESPARIISGTVIELGDS